MPRPIEHTAFARRSFAGVCHILERNAATMLEEATAAASRDTARLVRNADEELPHFDSTEKLTVIVGAPERDGDRHAWVEFTWSANRRKRLLANVDARLDIRPLVRRGPTATTELTLRGRYEPAPDTRHAPETVLFGRRVVKAALHRLLGEIVTYIEDYEETLESVIGD